ncbi:MAG: hypothetical protein V2A77_04155 [Pseudomonadota bacterium]
MFSAAEREAYLKKLRGRLRRWGGRWQELQGRREEAQADVRLRTARQLRQARRQRDAALKRLAELRHGGQAMWNETRQRLQGIAARLNEAVREASGKPGKHS